MLTRNTPASTLLSIDLSRNWTNATVSIQSNAKPSEVPNLNNPSLWYDENENLIYTGFAGWNSSYGNHPNMPPLSLWTLEPDGTGYGVWNEAIDSGSSIWKNLTRPSTPLTAYGSGLALILGGSADFYKPPATPNLLWGMVHFDMGDRSFTKSGAWCCNATNGVEKGAMICVHRLGQRACSSLWGAKMEQQITVSLD